MKQMNSTNQPKIKSKYKEKKISLNMKESVQLRIRWRAVKIENIEK